MFKCCCFFFASKKIIQQPNEVAYSLGDTQAVQQRSGSGEIIRPVAIDGRHINAERMFFSGRRVVPIVAEIEPCGHELVSRSDDSAFLTVVQGSGRPATR